MRPPIPPIRAPIEAIIDVNSFHDSSARKIINIIGATFCHVDINRQAGQDSPAITGGNQKCIGAMPNLIKSAVMINIIH